MGRERVARGGDLSLATSDGDIIDLVDRAIVVRDAQGIIIAWNVEAERLYGWTRAGAIGKSAHSLLSSSHPLTVVEVDRRLMDKGEWTGELARTSARGQTLQIALRCVARVDAQGARSIVEIGHDTASLPETERRAQLADHQYRNLFGAMTAALWQLDFGETRRMFEAAFNGGVTDIRAHLDEHPEFVRASLESTFVVDLNEKAMELYEIPDRAGMIGQSIARFWPAASLQIFVESLVAAVEGRPYYLAEVELQTFNLRPIQVLHTVAWPPENKGKGTVLVGAVDLTALRAAEGEKRRSDGRYRTIFQTTSVAFWELDFRSIHSLLAQLRAEGVTSLIDYARETPGFIDELLRSIPAADVNEASVELFGAQSRTQLLGSIDRFWPAASRHEFLRAVDANYRGEARFETEARLSTIDGREINVILTAVAPPDSAETGMIVIGILDVSERVAARLALDRMQAELAHAARVSILGELSASIAHEVNQPLAAIAANSSAAARWLNRAVPDLEEVKSINLSIGQDAERAGEIIQRIREMATKRPTDQRAISINDLIRQATSFLGHEIQGHSTELVLDLADDLDPVEADATQIQQVVINLAMNAMQAMRNAGSPQRRLRMVSRKGPVGGVEVEVADTGPGIPADALDRLFESFYTTKEGGLGIGLPICRSIVEASHGTIVARNNPDGGAAMVFTLGQPDRRPKILGQREAPQ